MALIELGIAAVATVDINRRLSAMWAASCAAAVVSLLFVIYKTHCGRSLLRSGNCKLRRELQFALRRMTAEVLRLAALLRLQAGYLWRKSGIWRD